MKIDRQALMTGVPLVDRQHERYAELVERFFEMAKQDHVAHKALEKEWEGVIAYAVEHFDAEEHLMFSKEYPHYDEHVAKHNAFREEVDRLSPQVRDPNTDLDAFTIKAGKWLVEWFCTQVQVDDMKMAAFLKGLQPGGMP